MSNKLTAIKIKLPNGTYSEQILISVLAQNVKYDRTRNLNDILNLLDNRINAVHEPVVSQPTRSWEGEVADIRNGYNGTAYQNAGIAVRTQIANLANSMVEVDNTLTTSGAAADAKKTGDEIADLKSAFDSFDPFSEEIKKAILDCFSRVVWKGSNGKEAFERLDEALCSLYKLPANTVFDGTTYYNTGIKLFENDMSFTIAGKFSFNYSSDWTTGSQIFTIRKNGSGWLSGFSINQNGVNTNISVLGKALTYSPALSNGDHTMKFVITHVAGSGNYQATMDIDGTQLTSVLEAEFISSTNILMIGCAYNADRPDIRYTYFRGTMQDFTVLSRNMTTSEINEYIGSVLYKLPANTVFDGTTYYNTGVKLFENDMSFTIACKCTFNYSSDWTTGSQIFTIRKNGSGWLSGFSINQNGVNTNISVLGKALTYSPALSNGDHTMKFVITHVAGSGNYQATMDIDGTQLTSVLEAEFISSTNILMIGCAYNADRPDIRYTYFRGTMQDFTVLKRALNTTEISDYMN